MWQGAYVEPLSTSKCRFFGENLFMLAFFCARMRPSFVIRFMRSVLCACTVVSLGCGTPTPVEDGGTEMDASEATDAGHDAGGRPCTTHGDCDDGVTCTNDICDPLGFCRNQPDFALCDDDVFCNGVEQCDLQQGCIPGPRRTCNDDNVCTIDRCNEETKTCDHASRDLDSDGDPDFFCQGGGDCDDRNPRRSSMIAEVCSDAIDNDCDNMVDEATCGRAPYDTCDAPYDISAGGTFVLDARGAMPDYSLGCTTTARRDLVLTFTLEAPRNVSIEARGDFFTTAIALRTSCSERTSELACHQGFPSSFRHRQLSAGTYFVVVSASAAGDVTVNASFTEPSPPPTNETCAAPIDISAGGVFNGEIFDTRDDLTTSCGIADSADLVYSFTTEAEQDVRITATAMTGESLAWEVRPTCDSSEGSVRCAYGGPATGRLHQLPAGTYFLVLEGSSHLSLAFSLEIEFLPPTPALAGDQCANAIPLELGVAASGTLADMEDDIVTSCGFHYRDAVYSFTLSERRDVVIDVGSGTRFMNASVRTACADRETERACGTGGPVQTRLRALPAGTYYVVVEALRSVNFQITVTDSEPTALVPVMDNETCASAHVIPETGGVFTGTTSGMSDDYSTAVCGAMARSPDAAFTLELTSRRRVVASTDGSAFDTVLYMYGSACTGTESACDDNAGEGTRSRIERTLDAGTYHFIVDGWGMVSSGEYVLDVAISDP
jgi:hypothetical protein